MDTEERYYVIREMRDTGNRVKGLQAAQAACAMLNEDAKATDDNPHTRSLYYTAPLEPVVLEGESLKEHNEAWNVPF